MKILTVSGFLGAGKTTFIRALSANTGKEIAVLENEYGGAGIDGEILTKETDTGEINIWEMTEGCICCSMKGDFASSVLTIANSVDPDYLVVEPTGVAYLGAVIGNLRQIEYDRIKILRPVTIVDGHSFTRYRREYPELYADQIASAGTVFVSKMENASSEEKETLADALREMNPGALIISEHYSAMSRREWLDVLEQEGGEAKESTSGRDSYGMPEDGGGTADIRASFDGGSVSGEELPDSFSIKNATMRSPDDLIFMLEALIRGKYGDIFRAKGVICSQGYNYRFDVADGLYCVTGADSEAEDSVVFIGKGMNRQALRRHFFEIKPGINKKF